MEENKSTPVSHTVSKNEDHTKSEQKQGEEDTKLDLVNMESTVSFFLANILMF